MDRWLGYNEFEGGGGQNGARGGVRGHHDSDGRQLGSSTPPGEHSRDISVPKQPPWGIPLGLRCPETIPLGKTAGTPLSRNNPLREHRNSPTGTNGKTIPKNYPRAKRRNQVAENNPRKQSRLGQVTQNSPPKQSPPAHRKTHQVKQSPKSIPLGAPMKKYVHKTIKHVAKQSFSAQNNPPNHAVSDFAKHAVPKQSPQTIPSNSHSSKASKTIPKNNPLKMDLLKTIPATDPKQTLRNSMPRKVSPPRRRTGLFLGPLCQNYPWGGIVF